MRILVAILLLSSGLHAYEATEAKKSSGAGSADTSETKKDPFARLTPYIGKWRGKTKCVNGLRGTHTVTVRRSKNKKHLIAYIRGRAPKGSTRIHTPGNIGKNAATIYIKPTKREDRFNWHYRLPAANKIATLLKIKFVKGTIHVSKAGRIVSARTKMGKIDDFYRISDTLHLAKDGDSFSHKYRELSMGKVLKCGGRTHRIPGTQKKKQKKQ
jgi:hypothetical protein